MADEASVVEEGSGAAQSPLVSVSFQRNVHRKEKYLEAEPKALGITQVGLSVYKITCMGVFVSQGMSQENTYIPILISSLLVIVAGSLAIAAQNLHLPTLRACFGMQIVAIGASIFNMVCTVIQLEQLGFYCWHYYDEPSNSTLYETCQKAESTHTHFYAEGVVIQAALLAISVTVSAYCYKVIQCCSPAPKMPVITVQVPPVQQ